MSCKYRIILFIFLFFSFFIHANNSENIYLIDFASVKLSSNYTKETLIHQKIKIENEKGKKFSHLQIPFDSEREKVKFIEGYTILPSGKKIKITSQDIKIVIPAEFTEYSSLYPGYKVMSINFPGVEIGSIIEYKYQIITFKPLIEKHFWDGFYFQSTENFALSRYELKIPKKIKIQIYEKDIKLFEKKESFDYITYIWEKRNVPPIIEEILMPSLSEVVPKVYVSTFSSWEEIGKWFFEISKTEKSKGKEIEEVVEQLIKNKKTEEEKIVSIYNYVCSNIRYVGLEMGIHGYKPHHPEEVLKAKYGDCKDKANLLKKMLEIAGIKSYIALVNTERKVEKEIPFPGQFNHAILAVLKENNYLFLDPTTEVMKYPDIPPYEQDKYSLVCGENPELVKIPVSQPERNLRKRIVYASLDRSGNLTGEVTVIPSGIFEAGLRNAFRYLKQIERERSLSKELNSILPGTKLISLEISGLESMENQLIEKYKFSTNNYGIKVGNKIIFQPALIDKLVDLSIVSLEERKYPLRLNTYYRKEEIIEYKLPEKTEIEAIPSSVEINEEFAKFFNEFKKTDSGLIFRRIFEINKMEISPEEYSRFKNFYRKVSFYDKLPVILNIKEE
ncbi:MAG TPA: DUF3857 domain-containing transglutaminase family protein [bacterium]|nr:DUF3857 domain-containing transglutaminase family protein [bacterium]HOM25979.1 DUF3857 domain-containing transglutaminase family protein [bacterium]